MSALKQNPFLIGFGVVMVLGVGALGYLAYSASEEHGKARSEYDEAAGELKRLQGLRPFPNDEHLKKFQAQKDELQGKVDALQKELASAKIKVEDISATSFQDKLRDTVARITTRAGQANVILPDKFYMGFPVYQAEPPKAPAAPGLYRQLRALELVMNLILETKNVRVDEVTREELNEEKAAKPVAPDPKKKPSAKEEEGRKLVEKERFTLKLTTTQENFQRILNGIATNKEQFFVPRYIVVVNEKTDPPAKVAFAPASPVPPADLANASGAVGATNPPATPADPNAPAVAPDPAAAAGPKLEYIFGKELVTVTMDVDLVDVKELEAKAKNEPKK